MDGLSNIAPYNEKKDNNEPKRAINKIQTGEREGERERGDPKKSTYVADSMTVSMSGVFPFLSCQQKFYTEVIQA